MRREAYERGADRLGFLVFGQEDNSHFLFVEVDGSKLGPERSFVVRIDGQALANGIISCHGDDASCSTVIPGGRRLRKSLAAGNALVIESRPRRAIKLQFPLGDFERARTRLL